MREPPVSRCAQFVAACLTILVVVTPFVGVVGGTIRAGGTSTKEIMAPRFSLSWILSSTSALTSTFTQCNTAAVKFAVRLWPCPSHQPLPLSDWALLL